MTDAYTTSMPNLAHVANALADERRAQMALTLIDGRAWTPTELATHHGWARSSVTEHLNILIDAGLISETRQGKHRYVRLANADVAEIIERLAAVSPIVRPAGPADRTLRAQRRNDRLRAARTCYSHLAGQLGVQLRNGLLRAGVVSSVNGYALTSEGSRWFDDLGYPVRRRSPADRRAVVRPCLDWTERVDHLAGIAADTLCHALTDLGWIIRNNTDRAVQVSPAGQTELRRLGLIRRESPAGDSHGHPHRPAETNDLQPAQAKPFTTLARSTAR